MAGLASSSCDGTSQFKEAPSHTASGMADDQGHALVEAVHDQRPIVWKPCGNSLLQDLGNVPRFDSTSIIAAVDCHQECPWLMLWGLLLVEEQARIAQ